MKYESEIRVDFENTMTIMLSQIKPDSTVLEFGPASGRMTKYLKEKNQCKMYIVELDEEAGLIAANYAVDYIIGDIENYEWQKKFAEIKFDYILFADVLEHLKNPKLVLDNAKNMLKDDGYIIASIPNIAHNSVIIDLMNNKFEYRPTGLLDNTHLKFWTYKSVEKLFKDVDLYVEVRNATYTQVGFNEFENTYNSVPNLNPFVLKSRKMGEVYQFVYTVTKRRNASNIDNIRRNMGYYFIQVFEDKGSGYDIDNNFIVNIDFDTKHKRFEFILSPETKILRVDPLNTRCSIKLDKIQGLKEGKLYDLSVKSENAKFTDHKYYYFSTDDPQIVFDFSGNKFEKVIMEIEYFNIDNDPMDIANIILKSCQEIISQKDSYIYEQRKILEENEKNISIMSSFIKKPMIKNIFELYLKLRKDNINNEKYK